MSAVQLPCAQKAAPVNPEHALSAKQGELCKKNPGVPTEEHREFTQIVSDNTPIVVRGPGGIGLFTAQIAKAFDVEVTGVCSSSNAALVE